MSSCNHKSSPHSLGSPLPPRVNNKMTCQLVTINFHLSARFLKVIYVHDLLQPLSLSHVVFTVERENKHSLNFQTKEGNTEDWKENKYGSL